MTSTLAPQLQFFPAGGEATTPVENDGAHTLLRSQSFRPAYVAQGAAILAYALALAGLCYLAKPKPIPQDLPIELTMVPDDTPPAQTPTLAEQTPDTPPVADPTPPEQTALANPETPPDQDLTPPPADQEESIAPVAPPPPPPAAVKQHHQRTKAAAVHTASSRRTAAGPASTSSASSAAPSYYANEVHARIAEVAGETVPDDFHGSGRVFYHIVIGPSGQLISKSLSSSGNALFDRAAAEALARAAPFPPPGTSRPVSLHGAIAYSQ
ncbi:MAG: TonB family protein [Pseudomonadota bacterium]